MISPDGEGARQLIVEPLDSGQSTLVLCRVLSLENPGFHGVPDVSDLFQVPDVPPVQCTPDLIKEQKHECFL